MAKVSPAQMSEKETKSSDYMVGLPAIVREHWLEERSRDERAQANCWIEEALCDLGLLTIWLSFAHSFLQTNLALFCFFPEQS